MYTPQALCSLLVDFYDSQGYHMELEGGRGGGRGIYEAEVSYSAIMYVTYERVATGRKISNIF
jgi:hypothetical protein